MVLGVVEKVDADHATFSVRCKNGDLFNAYVGAETAFNVLQNLDGLDLDRVAKGPGDDLAQRIRDYVSEG
jgi:hypothetical protein